MIPPPKAKQRNGEPVNCTNLELSIYLQALAEGYLPTCSLVTNASVPSRLNPIASKSYRKGKKTVSFHGFPYLRILKSSTVNHGADSSMLYAADFRAKISAQPEREKDSAENEAVFGQKCGAWFAKWDQDLSSWKTRQCSLFEGLELSWLNWPRWGIQQRGECFPLPMLVHDTSVKDFGCWPTPCKSDGRNWESSYVSLRNPSLTDMSPLEIHPNLHEILMGWPKDWTDLAPLEMDKFQQWLHSHGKL